MDSTEYLPPEYHIFPLTSPGFCHNVLGSLSTMAIFFEIPTKNILHLPTKYLGHCLEKM